MEIETLLIIAATLGIAAVVCFWLVQKSRATVSGGINLDRAKTYLFFVEAAFESKDQANRCAAATNSSKAKIEVFQSPNGKFWKICWEIKSKPGSLIFWIYRLKITILIELYKGRIVIEYVEVFNPIANG